MDKQEGSPFRSVLRLFLSVDIVGSTAFKQSSKSGLFSFAELTDEGPSNEELADNWFSPLVQFYRQIDQIFSRNWKIYTESEATNTGATAGAAPKLWKGIGDELIYYKDIANSTEALCCIHCWIDAVKSHRTTLKSKYPSLDLKSSAWLAGFPINNAEIIIRSGSLEYETNFDGDPFFENASLLSRFYKGETNGLSLDFLGPSIDIGFRISQLATYRKMTLSIDLALLLATVEVERIDPLDYGEFEFHYDGRVHLKGVADGFPYPIFWIDMLVGDRLQKIEDELVGRKKRSTKDVRDFARRFIADNNQHFTIPYIVSADEKSFDIVPAAHNERLKILRDALEGVRTRREVEKESEQPDADGAELSSEQKDSFVSRIATSLQEN